MKRGNLVLMITMLLLLLLVVSAQRPQTNPPPQTQPQVNEDRIEAAHGKLLSGEDRAKDASRLTEAVAPALTDAGSSTAPIPRKNFIDEHILGRMARDKIPHAPLAGDEEFLRRAYLDATGLLPAPDRVRSFVSDPDPNKRDKLIDSLIGSEEFTDEWAYHFGELLRTREAQFHLWTKQWLKVDRPYNDVFADIVTPTTKNAKGFPTAVAFYDPIGYIATRCGLWTDADDYKGLNRLDWVDEITSDIGRVFLGLSMDCFSCHNGAGHADSFNMFLGSRKRTDFWQQAAFFGKMRNIGYSDGSARNFYGGSSLFDDLAPGYNTGNDGFFYTPADIAAGKASAGQAARLGGMVEKRSVQHLPDGVTIRFVVTDGTTRMTVIDTGSVPALFQAGRGVIVEGEYGRDGAFHADTVLVKHNDRYEPPTPGETPTAIARKYGVKVSALMAANPRLDERRLQPGQTLNIPAP